MIVTYNTAGHQTKFDVEVTNLFSLGLGHVGQQHGPEDWGPGTEKDLVAVEDSALALHLDISEVFAVEDQLQVLAQLLLLPLLGLQAPDGFLGIFGARERLLCSDNGDVADDGESVVGKPLGGSALQDVGVDELPEAPGVRFLFELGER